MYHPAVVVLSVPVSLSVCVFSVAVLQALHIQLQQHFFIQCRAVPCWDVTNLDEVSMRSQEPFVTSQGADFHNCVIRHT